VAEVQFRPPQWLERISEPRLTGTEVGHLLGVCYNTVHTWLTRGVGGRVLPSYFVGGRRYIRKSDLEQFVAGMTGRSGHAS
jgi:excisionase family DNA binding protein